jgi:5-formyltetrahydrofolate cyclo-ligase
VAPRTALAFREWHPDAVLLPMNGWDAQGYRLGYGAGFFDRALASLDARPRRGNSWCREGDSNPHSVATGGF